MAPRTKKQLDEIREGKRDLILNTALEVFATHGFHGSSVSMIAQHAGIAKGLIYNYFLSKEDLLREIIMIGVKELVKRFTPIKKGDITGDELALIINEYLGMLQAYQEYWRLYFSVMIQPPVVDFMKKLDVAEIGEPIFAPLRAYFAKKGFPDPDGEVQLIHVLMDGVFMNYITHPELIDLEYFKKFLVQRYCQ